VRVRRILLRAHGRAPLAEARPHGGGAGPLLWRHVAGLAGVGPQVKELHLAVVVVLHELPPPLTHRAGGPAALVGVVRDVPVQRTAARGWRVRGEHPRLADAVDRRNRRRPGELEKRRHPVRVEEGRVDDPAFRQPRPPDDQRHAQPAFVEVSLARAERRVVRHARVTALGHVQAAVVAREHDDRAVPQARGIEMPEQAADRVVERLDGRGVAWLERAAVGVDELLLRRVRDVRVVVCQVEEERPLAVCIDEAQRLPRQVVLPLAAFALVGRGGGLTGVMDVESLLARAVAGPAQVPLADCRGRVARRAQPLGDGRLVERQLLADCRMQQFLRRRVGASGQVRRQMQARRRPSGHQRRARGRADRRRHVCRGEPQPRGREAIQIRRAVIPSAISGEIVHAQIVSEYEDDVGGRPLHRRSRIDGRQQSAADDCGDRDDRCAPGQCQSGHDRLPIRRRWRDSLRRTPAQ
jgi:hypothetical protein